MPRYFFHAADGRRDRDDQGTELPDDTEAKRALVEYAGEMMREAPDDLWAHRQLRVEVTDDSGALRWSVIMLAVDAPDPADHHPAEPAAN